MKYLKSYEEKLNESIIVASIATFIILRELLFLLVMSNNNFRKNITNKTSIISNIKKDEINSNKLEELIGLEIEVYSCDSKEHAAFAIVGEIYYNNFLKEILNERELMAVLLHECHHVLNRDAQKDLIRKIFYYIPVIFFSGWLYLILLKFLEPIFTSLFGKYKEFKSDDYANKYGYGEDLASALVKLRKYSFRWKKSKKLSKIKKLFKKLYKNFRTHPSIEQRISKLYKEKTPQEFIKYVNNQMKNNQSYES